ncbi:MAG TPA: outer membrane beta-barrel protein [Chitinophagales bacterium]|nr:outer membrane beta-barrel protein [Chitinophagales bacterium]
MRKLLLLLLTVSIGIATQAQTTRYRFELAAEGGPGFSYIYGAGAKQLKKQSPLLSYTTGLGLRYNTPKVAGIYTGVYIERKGFDWPIAGATADGKSKTLHYYAQYNYVTIPVMINATVGKKVQFFVNAGGYVSALFRIHTFQKELGINNVNPGGYQYVDAGFSGGVGLRVPFARGFVFSLEARNSTGFMKVIKNTERKDAFYNTNTTFIAGIAYSFKPSIKKNKPQHPLRDYFYTITYPYSNK